ncbi:MAG: hypothetical protein ACLPJH_20310 [Myxococcaceae bacterium]
MKATKRLQDRGQSLWLSHLLASGGLRGDNDGLSVTGLTSKPDILDDAIQALAAKLQEEGARACVACWTEFLSCIESKSVAIRKKAS